MCCCSTLRHRGWCDLCRSAYTAKPSFKENSAAIRRERGRGKKREIVVIIFTVWNSREASISSVIYGAVKKEKKDVSIFMFLLKMCLRLSRLQQPQIYISACNVEDPFGVAARGR